MRIRSEADFKNEFFTFKTKNILLLFIIVIAFITPILPLHAKIPRLAILDFKARHGISAGEAQTITDMIRVHFMNFQVFKVVERSKSKAALRKQAFLKSGCADTSCAVKVGRLLAADKIMIGSVAKIENTYFITARIIDINKEIVDFAETTSYQLAAELKYKITAFARKIVRRILNLKDNTYIAFTPGQRAEARQKTLEFPGLGHFKVKRNVPGLLFSTSYAWSLYNLIILTPSRVKGLREDSADERLVIPLIYTLAKSFPGMVSTDLIDRPGVQLLFLGGLTMSAELREERITKIKYRSYLLPLLVMGLAFLDLTYYFDSLDDARFGATLKYDQNSGPSLGLVFRYRF